MLLANLATATRAYRTLVTLLTKTVTELSTQFTTLTTKLLTTHSENTCLKIAGHSLANEGAPDNGGHCLANVGTPSDQNPLRERNIYSRKR